MQIFNKTSAGFLVRFALILLLSFAFLFVVEFYLLSNVEEPPPAQVESATGV